MAEFWIEPGAERRDLFGGPRAVDALHPEPDARYEVLERDTRGFSITYHLRDARGREWHAKIGPEAQTEVVASRIVWGLGYHEVPSYFIERWIAVEKSKGSVLGGARFRPRELGLKSLGSWSWQQNPFVGTRPYNGLLVVMMILNGGFVRFAYRGRHQELVDRLSADDVRWACERVQRLSNRQLRDAFRAGNFGDEIASRFIARIRQKADEGLRIQ